MYLCHPPRVVHFSLHSGFVLDYVAARYQILPVATTYSSTFLRSRTLSAPSPSLQSIVSASRPSPSLRERRFKRVFLRTFGPTHTCATICRSRLKTDKMVGRIHSINFSSRSASQPLPSSPSGPYDRGSVHSRTSRSLVAVRVRLQ